MRTAVGISDIRELAEVQGHFSLGDYEGKRAVIVTTRNMPKRRAEVLEGGSLYWIIKNRIQARQLFLGMEQIVDEDGKKQCVFFLDPVIVQTKPKNRRAVQGWRYLEISKSPSDIGEYHSADIGDMDAQMVDELRELGLL